MARWLRKLSLRARSLFRARQVETELDDELQFHLETYTEQGMARGLTRDEARRRALIRLGGIEPQKEAVRDTRGLRAIDTITRDVRYGLRALRAQPGFTIAAVLSLALGIGANAAIFQVIDAVRLRTLPVPRAHELAEIRLAAGQGRFGISNGTHASYPLWEHIRRHQRAFAGVFGWSATQMIAGRDPDARVIRLLWVTGEAFPILDIAPALGRLLDASDERPCSSAVVLSHAYWHAQFGGARDVTGRTVFLLDRALPIVGVAPPDFFGLNVGTQFDVALPACANANWGARLDRRDWFWLSVVGRLKDGWSVDRAAADMRQLSPSLFAATVPSGYGDGPTSLYRSFQYTVEPASRGVSDLRTEYGSALWLLLAMTGLVLVLACTNIMNLLLARGTARGHEVALRLAIGASRGRVTAQLLVESLLLALGGSVLGAAIAAPLSARLVALLSTDGNPLYLDLQPGWTMFAFTALVGSIACVAFGLIPALRAARTQPHAALRAGARGITASRERLLAQRVLVVAQVVVSLVLIFGAALFVRTFDNLSSVDLGITPRNLIGVRMGDPTTADASAAETIARHDALLDTLRALPGVASVASTSRLPLEGGSWSFAVVAPGTDPSKDTSSRFTYVSPHYFATVGQPVLRGREFTSSDRAGSRPVLVVNEAFVRRHLSNVAPLGATVRTVAEPGYPETAFEVVGVVRNEIYSGVRSPHEPVAYVPMAQHPLQRGWPALLVRASGDADGVTTAVRRAIAERHPNMVMGFSAVEREIGDRLVRERVMAWLAGAFGVVAALLAFVGIYGVISYVVQRRRHELAIRLALGAGRARIVRLVAGQLGALLAVGLMAGGALALLVAGGAGALLFGLTARDPLSLAASLALLTAIAAIACAIPAIRASRIEAANALRSE